MVSEGDRQVHTARHWLEMRNAGSISADEQTEMARRVGVDVAALDSLGLRDLALLGARIESFWCPEARRPSHPAPPHASDVWLVFDTEKPRSE